MVRVLKLGIRDPRLDALAVAAPLTPERLAWQLGVQALARHEYQRAIGLLGQGVHSDQVNPMQLGLLGQAYYGTGDYMTAIRFWERGRASAVLYEKGNEAQEAGDFPKAIEFLESFSRVAPTEPHAHYLLAYAYHRVGNPRRAVREAQEAIRLDGGRNLGYRSMLAWIYEMTGELSKAYEEYQTILSVSPDHAQAREGLLRVENALKERRK
jgi:tetratricopeptide (TPR) repeat protein